MKYSKSIALLAVLLALVMVIGCGGSGSGDSNDSTVSDSGSGDSTSDGTTTVANSDDHDDPGDYTWDESEVIEITLNGNSISADSADVTVDGTTAVISASGTYRLSGTLWDGQIKVDAGDDDLVRLIFNSADIANSQGPPVDAENAGKVVIFLTDDTENVLTDAAVYVLEDPTSDEPNAALFSTCDLTIFGGGILTVNGNYNDGIAGKDGLIIAAGTIRVNAADDGIRGKDYIVVKDGDITVTAGGDGLKSDNSEDADRGYITVEGGVLDITAGGDAVQAEKDVQIVNGNFTLTTAGGSGATIDLANESAKGIKAGVGIVIAAGTFVIDTADDGIHANSTIEINGGIFNITSADDGMHADTRLTINDGDIIISKSYEGLESAVITINNGDMDIVSSDDGINVAGGVDGSAGGRPGAGDFTSLEDYQLYINGGYILVNAGGDGVDSNGSFEMTGGELLVHGPTDNGNGALDYGAFKITGGFIVAAGSSGMAQAAGSNTSDQNALLLNFSAVQTAGTLVHIQSDDGEEILTFAPLKNYQSITFSSAELVNGTSYDIYSGGSSSGSEAGGLYSGGTYSPGTLYTSFTVSNLVTTIGSTRGGF